MLCKTEWSWELRTWSYKMNLLDILSTFPHYLCRKLTGQQMRFQSLIVIHITMLFVLGAMSFGSISYETHTTLAKAMNKWVDVSTAVPFIPGNQFRLRWPMSWRNWKSCTVFLLLKSELVRRKFKQHLSGGNKDVKFLVNGCSRYVMVWYGMVCTWILKECIQVQKKERKQNVVRSCVYVCYPRCGNRISHSNRAGGG